VLVRIGKVETSATNGGNERVPAAKSDAAQRVFEFPEKNCRGDKIAYF
jgi:hypothetical protein